MSDNRVIDAWKIKRAADELAVIPAEMRVALAQKRGLVHGGELTDDQIIELGPLRKIAFIADDLRELIKGMLPCLALLLVLAGCQSMGADLPECTSHCAVVVVMPDATMSRGGNSPATTATAPLLP